MNNKALIALLILVYVSCSNQEAEYVENPQYALRVPSNFPGPPATPDNPLTAAGVALGEKLFFDPMLSGNNQVSCATCHIPELAFSDGIALSSKGISGKSLMRHVPALINLAWADNGLFWDGGSKNLESQAFAPLAHEDEMFQDLMLLEQELTKNTQYSQLFKEAFNQEISSNLVMQALAQYQRTLVFAESTYDQYVRGEDEVLLNALEQDGYTIYLNKCAQCHASDLFTDNAYHNNGLDASFDNTDHDELFLGRFRVNRNLEDLGAYKTPTLRNVMITAPYMHDGRFETLEEVLEFYNSGVQDSEFLDPILKSENQVGIALSAQDKKALLAFLNTLTDTQFQHLN